MRSAWWLFGPFALALGMVTGCALLAGVEDGELDPSLTGGGQATGAAGTGGHGGAGAASTGGGSTGGGSTGGSGTGGGVGGTVEGMVNVNGGPFMMGCNDGVDDDCNIDENPYHEVNVSGFRIDQFEVTRGEYADCVTAAVCTEPPCDWHPTELSDHPVTCVSWEDAKTYCEFVSKRLPTEAEWEKAARGDTGNRYPWGNTFGDDCSLVNGNLCRNDAEPVGTHPTGASPYGALDMAGNVTEWVADWYSQTYYDVSPADDPTGPDNGGVRVRRGGSWNDATFDFRVSSRLPNIPTLRDNETGFRCAL